MAEQTDEHGRHAREGGNAALTDLAQYRQHVKTRVQVDLGGSTQAKDHIHHQRVDVERRQHCQHPLLPGHDRRTQHLAQLGTGGRDIAVGQHRPLGDAGGAAGILQHSQRVGRIGQQVLPIIAGIVPQLGKTAALIAPGHHRRFAKQMALLVADLTTELDQTAHDQLTQPSARHQARHTRVKGLQIQRQHDVGLTVLDLVLEGAFSIQR